jgi:hypothetical protein
MRALVGVLVLAFFAAACGSGASSAATQSPGPSTRCGSAGKHHVYVEVVNGGRVIATGCAGFDGANLDALTVMQHSGVQYATQKFSFGTAICQIDHIPASYAQCLPQNAPYWADWTWNGSAWASVQTGPEQVMLADHQALGWVYTSASGSPAPPPPPPAT